MKYKNIYIILTIFLIFSLIYIKNIPTNNEIITINLLESTYDSLDKRDEIKSTNNEKETLSINNIYNILLIGRDGVDNSKNSRSDSMIILTIDEKNKALRLTSLARDTLVYIPERGYEKLNHAYAYGKEELLIETINKNLDLNIKDYAVVNFKSFIEIIDIIGGVDVDIKDKEVKHLNEVIKACYNINTQNEIEYIYNPGSQTLNGYQALAYARMRKIDSIYKRDERQKVILSSIAKKLANTSITKYTEVAKSILNHIKFNISIDKIMELAFMSREFATYDINQMEFPSKDYREDAQIGEDKIYVTKWDEVKNKEILHDFINGK